MSSTDNTDNDNDPYQEPHVHDDVYDSAFDNDKTRVREVVALCPHCKNSDILCTISHRWDIERQQFLPILSAPMIGHCQRCLNTFSKPDWDTVVPPADYPV